MGRNKIEKPKNLTVFARVDITLSDKISKIAYELDRSKSFVVNMILKDNVDKYVK